MKISKKLFEHLKTLTVAELTEDGKELLNPTPMQIDVEPVGMTLEEKIQRAIKINELSKQAAMQGEETWEEFNDFDVKDSDDIPEFAQSEFEIMEDDDWDRVEPPLDVVDKKDGLEGSRDAAAEDVDQNDPPSNDDSGSESPPESKTA